MRFDHIGVAARTLSAGRKVLSDTIQISDWTDAFEDPVNRIWCQFGRDDSDVCYELVAPLGDDSPIADALRTRTRILNHVAYLVDDLEREAARLAAVGCVTVTQPNPAVAYAGARIQFFLNRLSFVMELIEAPAHHHQYVSSDASQATRPGRSPPPPRRFGR